MLAILLLPFQLALVISTISHSVNITSHKLTLSTMSPLPLAQAPLLSLWPLITAAPTMLIKTVTSLMALGQHVAKPTIIITFIISL